MGKDVNTEIRTLEERGGGARRQPVPAAEPGAPPPGQGRAGLPVHDNRPGAALHGPRTGELAAAIRQREVRKGDV